MNFSTLNKRIKYYRKKMGYTQEYVATALGIKTSNYAKYESGERNPKDDRILELAKIFDVPYDALITGAEREALELIYRHLKGAVVGNVERFEEFGNDLTIGYSIYKEIADQFSYWETAILKEMYYEFYVKYLDNPNISTLIKLNKEYRMLCDQYDQALYNNETDTIDPHCIFGDDVLDDTVIYKMAYCIAVDKYMFICGDFSFDNIYHDICNYLGDKAMEKRDALQYFTINILGQFISDVTDTLEFVTWNSNIDDFAIAFMYDSLTPPEEADEWDDLN